MITNTHLAHSTNHPTSVIRLTIPRAEITTVMGPAIQEVLAAVAAQGASGVERNGPVFSYHYRMTPEVFDFEVGLPIKGDFKPTGRVQQSSLRATKVARADYFGPYEGLGAAWGEFMAWIEKEGLQPGEDLWEFYAVDPASGLPPAEWRTEFYRPVA